MQDFNNKKLSISLWYKNQDNEDEVIVYTGIVRQQKGVFYLHRGKGRKKLKILNEWTERIKKVEDREVKKILLGASYSLSLTVGDISDDLNDEEFISTGLKWIN